MMMMMLVMASEMHYLTVSVSMIISPLEEVRLL